MGNKLRKEAPVLPSDQTRRKLMRNVPWSSSVGFVGEMKVKSWGCNSPQSNDEERWLLVGIYGSIRTLLKFEIPKASSTHRLCDNEKSGIFWRCYFHFMHHQDNFESPLNFP